MGLKVRRTTLQLWAFIAVLLGLGLAYWGFKPSPIWLIVIVFLAIGMRQRNFVKILAVIILALSLGLWRGNVVKERLQIYDDFYDKKVSLTVKAREDANYNKYKQLSFDAGNLKLNEGGSLPGKILVSGYGSNSILQDDLVLIEGKLRPAYGTYVAKISYAQITVLEHRPSVVATFKRNFAKGMQNALPEPMSSFAMGLLIGQRVSLSEEVKRDLLMVGLTHIIAVSGYNLTIILNASRGLLEKRSKRLSLLLSVSLILLFLMITGASASIVRAVIVSMLSIWALYYGRNMKPLNLLVLSAAITAWANPLYVWADMSWYLSFLAFYGVIVIAPLAAIKFRRKLRESLLFMIGLESICAEIMTLPYVLHNFEQISIVGLPANVLVATPTPIAMFLSFIAGLAGMIFPAIASWLAWPAKVVTTYMLDVAHILSLIPHGFTENISISLLQMITMYVLVMLMTSLLWFKNKPESVKITDSK